MDEIKRIEGAFGNPGFWGCISCLDCSRWAGKRFPKALQVIIVGKDGNTDLRIEGIYSVDFWIWSFQFGLADAMKDLNIIALSSHFPLF